MVVPRRQQLAAFEKYQLDRTNGTEETERLQATLKDAVEANRRAYEALSPAVKTKGQADLRSFLSPKMPARELQAEFADADEGQEGSRDEEVGSQHGSSA